MIPGEIHRDERDSRRRTSRAPNLDTRHEPDPTATQLLHLQRLAGNAAVTSVVQREPAPAGPGPAVKHTATFPDFTLMKKDAGYAQAELALGGTLEFEAKPKSTGGEGGGPEIGSSGGVNFEDEGPKYQAEVTAEFQKRTTGILEGCTPKAKLGGEASTDGGKLGLELSLEGDTYESKFGFTLLEIEENDGITFATLEAGIDWKMKDWEFTSSDGTQVKVSAKPTIKITVEPNYKRIFLTLAEEGAAVVAGEALIAGGFIAVGVMTIVGTALVLGDGEDEANAIDKATYARRRMTDAFVAGALGEKPSFDDGLAMEGYLQGEQWRRDVEAGNNQRGLPVPKNVMAQKSRENQQQIRDSAYKKSTQLMRQALVERYWEIHYIDRHMPWAEINTRFTMLMEAQDFGRPAPDEGKTSGGVSVLPE